MMPAMEFSGRELDWGFDPLAALGRWPLDRRVCLLHSGRLHGRWARWSILAEPVGAYRFVGRDAVESTEARPPTAPAPRRGESQWVGPPDLCPSGEFAHRPFRDLRRVVGHAAARNALWIGYLSYDVGRWVERLPAQAADDRRWPIVELGCCPGYLAYDGVKQRWLACGTWRDGGLPELRATEAPHGRFAAAGLRSTFEQADYEAAVARVIDYIAAGDVFQVNLTQRFSAEFDGVFPAAHRAVFDRLATTSPAWYGAYLELAPQAAAPGRPAKQRVIASTSPELFLEVDADGQVVTRPIKGTRPSTVDPVVLANSEKDAAELNMIVDLLRNDLGRVCSYGSVQVSEPRTIETHPTIHHGVATIRGTLHEGRDLIDLLRATLPGGSITGAPKVRTMEIIEQLEPVRRGPYCGCIGLLSPEQTCLNIAIRTMLIESPADSAAGQGRVDFAVGGGIVADSDPAMEYQETLDKAAAILKTLRLEPPG